MRGLLLYGDTVRAPALRHELPIAIIDPVLFAEVDGRRYVLTSSSGARPHQARAPRGRAARLRGARLPEVRPAGHVDARGRTRGRGPGGAGDRDRGGDRARRFSARARRPAARGRRRAHRRRRCRRAAASGEEPGRARGHPRRAAGGRGGMAAAADVLARSAPGAEDGRLELDGEPLLAEDVRATLRAACEEHGAPCPPDVIVASVWQGNGHEPGSGPLPAGLPIPSTSGRSTRRAAAGPTWREHSWSASRLRSMPSRSPSRPTRSRRARAGQRRPSARGSRDASSSTHLRRVRGRRLPHPADRRTRRGGRLPALARPRRRARGARGAARSGSRVASRWSSAT